MANTVNYNQQKTYDPQNPIGGAVDSILGTGLTLVNPVLGAAYNVGSGIFKALKYPFDKRRAESMSGETQTFTSSDDINRLGGRERGEATEFTTTEVTSNYEVANPWASIANNAVNAGVGLSLAPDTFDGLGTKLDSIFGRKDNISSGARLITDRSDIAPVGAPGSVPGFNPNAVIPEAGSTVGITGKREAAKPILDLLNFANNFNTNPFIK